MIPYDCEVSWPSYRHWLPDRRGPHDRGAVATGGGKAAGHALPQSPEGAGAGEPSLPLPAGVAPRPSRLPAGGGRASPLSVNPARVWGAGPATTVAGPTDNETHGVAIPARSVAQPLSPPHRATQRLSLLGDPSTHPTGGQGHREAGRQATGQAGPAQTMGLTHRGEREGGEEGGSGEGGSGSSDP
jgi:hypothetical protein